MAASPEYKLNKQRWDATSRFYVWTARVGVPDPHWVFDRAIPDAVEVVASHTTREAAEADARERNQQHAARTSTVEILAAAITGGR
jgi:hypothetical protein